MIQRQQEPRRADALHNRDRILEVARDAFAASGDASLNSIAKQAGVGPGTLYRHFPNREALVLAVYRHDVQQLADSAPLLLDEHPPLAALRLWFDRLAYYGKIKHGLADVLHAVTSDGLAGETYGPVIGAITLLLRACEQRTEIAAIELNVSCPNVKTGLDIGADPIQLERVLAEVRPATGKPLIVKLTPNCANVADCAQAAQDGGADAVSLINTLRALALAPPGAPALQSSRPTTWLGGGMGGLSGAAVRPVALAQVAAVAGRVSIPVVGMGGVQSATHARQLLDVGATLVAVGTESFRNPAAAAQIAKELICELAPG